MTDLTRREFLEATGILALCTAFNVELPEKKTYKRVPFKLYIDGVEVKKPEGVKGSWYVFNISHPFPVGAIHCGPGDRYKIPSFRDDKPEYTLAVWNVPFPFPSPEKQYWRKYQVELLSSLVTVKGVAVLSYFCSETFELRFDGEPEVKKV